MNSEDTPIEPQSKLKQIQTHISRIERAFGEVDDIDPKDPEARAKAEEFKKQAMKDREEFIKLYQPAAMNYARGVLIKLAKQWNAPFDVNQDVPAVWSNLVLLLLDGKYTSFKHKGIEGSFRVWLRRVIANECKGYLMDQGRVLGKRGPKNAAPLSAEADPETFDPEDRTLEATMRGTLISKTYATMEEAGLYGEAVLFWEKHNSAKNAAKEQLAIEGDTEDASAELAASKDARLNQELAIYLSEVSGKTIAPDNAKKYLERGKDLFARNFIDQVAKFDGMFDGAYDVDRIEETLIELEFLCKQKTKRKGVSDTQFSRRLRRILDSLR